MVPALLLTAIAALPEMPSIRAFGVLPENTPEANQAALQKAIDWAASRGAALYVEPSDTPYPMAGGTILRRNVSLIGAHGPVGRGTKHPDKPQPVGSVFAIQDRSKPFLTVESATQVRGIQFWYPDQTLTEPDQVIPYPPTIQVSQTSATQGVTLRDLTFYGEWFAMDFGAPASAPCEQILIEHCYGFPLSGRFVQIDRCYDVPRVLNCHVNPANMRQFRGDFAKAVIDSVIRRKTFAYDIDRTDNAHLRGVFTFGTFGGIRLGPASYGQLTDFNFDCVNTGIWKLGDSEFNRNWMVSNGSIIANVGEKVADTHPVVVEGKGHLSLSNVEAFSGGNPALTTLGQSQDYLLVRGSDLLTISLFGCRMRNYAGDHPFTVLNPKARIQAVGCWDKNQNPFAFPTSG